MTSTPLGPDLASSFVNAWQQTFVLAANDWEFKNGAFKNKITSVTSALEAVELLLASELTSADEKRVLEKGRQAASIRTALIRGSQMSIDETLMLGAETLAITNMFEEDRKKQGQYVPPMLVHSLGEGNKVTKTMEITDDGVKETAGGKIGYAPSAPPGWNQQNADKMSQVWIPGKAGGDGKEGATASTPIQTGATATRTRDKKVARKPWPKRQGKTNNEFGGAFQDNLRGAFS